MKPQSAQRGGNKLSYKILRVNAFSVISVVKDNTDKFKNGGINESR